MTKGHPRRRSSRTWRLRGRAAPAPIPSRYAHATPAPDRRPAPPRPPAKAAGCPPAEPPAARRKLSSIRPDTPGAPGNPKPPARPPATAPAAAQADAKRVAPRLGDDAGHAPARPKARGSPSRAARAHRHPADPRPPAPAVVRNSSPGSRVANTSATDSASSRRATNASTCAEARSSHCASSTTHKRGCCSATSDSRLKTASPTRNRSGARPSHQTERDAKRIS